MSFTPLGRGKDGLSRKRRTLAISTSCLLASSAAVVNVVRIVPPTAYAFMITNRMVISSGASP